MSFALERSALRISFGNDHREIRSASVGEPRHAFEVAPDWKLEFWLAIVDDYYPVTPLQRCDAQAPVERTPGAWPTGPSTHALTDSVGESCEQKFAVMGTREERETTS